MLLPIPGERFKGSRGKSRLEVFAAKQQRNEGFFSNPWFDTGWKERFPFLEFFKKNG
jgi:hypothetical protein